MNYTTEVFIELDGFVADVKVDFEYYPGEAAVMYYDGGNGYPGAAPEIYLTRASIIRFIGHHTVWRDEMHGWEKDLDRLFLAQAENALNFELYDQLVAHVEED